MKPLYPTDLACRSRRMLTTYSTQAGKSGDQWHIGSRRTGADDTLHGSTSCSTVWQEQAGLLIAAPNRKGALFRSDTDLWVCAMVLYTDSRNTTAGKKVMTILNW